MCRFPAILRLKAASRIPCAKYYYLKYNKIERREREKGKRGREGRERDIKQNYKYP